jgi:hypothetical protein
MDTKFKPMLIFSLFLLACFPLRSASADTGPKPSMDFTFKQDPSATPLTITSGILYECDQADCQDARPLEEMGLQGFSCDATTCSALAYGFSTWHRIEIEFSDGTTRQSNIFKKTQFQANYQVTIRQDDLLVEEKFSLNPFTPLTYILICGGCLIAITILILLIVLLVRRSKKKP